MSQKEHVDCKDGSFYNLSLMFATEPIFILESEKKKKIAALIFNPKKD